VISAAAVVLSEGGCHLGSGCGFPAPDAGIFEFAPYASFTLFGITFDLTKSSLLVILGAALIVVFFLVAFGRPRLVPRPVQNVGEMGYLFIRDQIARDVIGKEGDRYVPFLGSLFFFVWIMNIFGIIPTAQFPPMSRFAFPVTLALMVWVLYMYLGLKHQGPVKFFTNMMFPPGIPKPIYVILAPIELISNILVRPFTLAVRLFANMFAGHLLLTVFTIGAWYLLSPSLMGAIGSATSFLVTVILTGFEMLIQALQAFIFTLLTAVYISGSLHAEH
jgi:F-type H+-transporting ATPase subunit a